MTPEEYFERINKTLDRMASEAAAKAATNELRFMRIEDIQVKAERWREYLVESQAQLASDLTTLTADLIQLTKAVKDTNQSVGTLVRLFEDHLRDDHGGEGKKQ